MNKAIKYHVLFLFLIFGLFSTVEAMEHVALPPKEQQTTQQKIMAQWVVFKKKFSTGFSWIMKKIQLYYQSWFSTPVPSPQQSTQKFSSWQNIPNAIYFYDSKKPYYEFTNFYESPNQFELDGEKWNTVEQYYQASKFHELPIMQKKIREFTSDRQKSAAGKAFAFAQENDNLVRKDWRQVNIGIMLTAVRAKFEQNNGLNEQLKSTKEKILVEDSPKDSFYGRGSNWKGDNHLGRILMHVRDEIRQGKESRYDPATTHNLISTTTHSTPQQQATTSPAPTTTAKPVQSTTITDFKEEMNRFDPGMQAFRQFGVQDIGNEYAVNSDFLLTTIRSSKDKLNVYQQDLLGLKDTYIGYLNQSNTNEKISHVNLLEKIIDDSLYILDRGKEHYTKNPNVVNNTQVKSELKTIFKSIVTDLKLFMGLVMDILQKTGSNTQAAKLSTNLNKANSTGGIFDVINRLK